MTVSQGDFARAILDPETPAPSGLENPGGAQASKRFDVYRNNVAVSLTEALEAAFPVVRKLVGDEFFRAMAGVYLRKHPPKSPLMMHYGDAMPQFLTRFQPAKSLAYLPDIARLEIAQRRAYHARDAGAMDPQMLAAITPDDLMAVRFQFAPAVQVVASDHPVLGIWRANIDADATPPVQRPETVLITRPVFDPELHLIDAAAGVCITALMAGKSLALAMTDAGPDLDLGAVLSLLLAQNALCELTSRN